MILNDIGHPGQGRPGFEAVVLNELASILATQSFQRSPLLSKLLNYLVNETLRGNGDSLKAYTIAIDGLGRPENFDAKNDSYPRVQMVRLRSALGTHYAKHGPEGDLCLYFRPGSYRTRLGSMGVAYPELYRPLSAKAGGVAQAQASDPITNALGLLPDRNTIVSKRAALIASALGIAALVCVLMFGHFDLLPFQHSLKIVKTDSPVTLVAVSSTGSRPEEASLTRTLSARLIDGLRRSWTTQIQLGPGGIGIARATPSYRLDVQIEYDGGGKAVVYSRLDDVRTGTIAWSKTITSSALKTDIETIVTSIIVEVASPTGVIVAQEMRNLQPGDNAGYPCILRYFRFLNSRDPGLEAEITDCLSQPVREDRIRASVFAVRSFFELEKSAGAPNRKARVGTALSFAKNARDTDSNDAYSQLALARISYISDDCVSGNYHSRLAFAANPYDPALTSLLATHAKRCGHPDAAALLDRAFALMSEGNSYARLPLIVSAIMYGEPERLATLPPNRKPTNGASLVNYYLCETLTAAGLRQQARALANWGNFKAALPAKLSTNDARLRQIILSDTLRAAMIDYLVQNGIATTTTD